MLDLAQNKCSDPAILTEVIVKLPALRVLYFTNNEIIKKIPNYRKRLVQDLSILTFLDDRPVFPEDRRFVSAFYQGGIEAEREERKAFQREKEEERLRNHLAFHAMIAEAREGRRIIAGNEEESGSQSTTIPSMPASSDEEAKSQDAGNSASEGLQPSSSSETEEHQVDSIVEEVKFEPVHTPPASEESFAPIWKLDPVTDSDLPPPLEPASGPTFTIEEVVQETTAPKDLLSLD